MRVRRIVASVTTAAMVMGGVSLVAAPASSAGTCPTLSGPNAPFTVTPAPTPGVDWSGCDLTDANLTFANLIYAHLGNANLTSANLDNANLDNADLTDANLTRANLRHANLANANLSFANLDNANLSFANLSFADLSGADLSGADLSGADLTLANLGNATLRGVDLTRATLRGADLTDAILTGANLGNADLTRANLTDADLTDANLDNANLDNADLKGAFVECPTGGILGSAIIGVPLSLPAGWTLVGGVLTVPVVACATVVLDVPTPVSVGVSVTVQATVTPATAAGVVKFFANGTSLGTAPVTGGVATLPWVPTAPGTVNLGVQYIAIDIPPGGVPGAGTGKVVTVAASPTTTPTTTPITTVTKPGNVRGLKAENTSKRKVTLSWRAPSTGSPRVRYQYRAKGMTKWKTTTSTKATVKSTKFKKRTKVTFQVRAQNTAGKGPVTSKRIKITR